MSLPERARGGLLMAIVQYAPDGTMPERLTQSQLVVMPLAMPTLDASRRKALGDMNGSSNKSKQKDMEK